MTISLRDYQKDCVDAVWSAINKQSTALVSMSTGSGKSRIIAALIEKSLTAKPDLKVLVLFNKVELLTQQVNGFRSLLGKDKIGVYCGTEQEWDLSKSVTVGSIQSLDPHHLNFNLIVVDECFTGDTEVLTENGFIRFDSLTKKEMIAQFNSENSEISFCYPSRYIEKEYDGEIIVAKNKNGVEIHATPNHEILLKRNNRNVKLPFHKVNFNYLNKIYKSGLAVGYEDTLSPYEKLMIALQADGSVHSKNKIYFSFSKERKIKEFLKLMEDGGFLFKEVKSSNNNLSINTNKKRRFSVHIEEKFSKNIYEFFDLKSLSLKKCKEIIEYMVIWDGHLRNKDHYYYSSVDKKNVDFYQAVACLAGHSSVMTVQVDNRSDTFSDVHRLFIRLNTSTCDTQNVKKEYKKYSGKVYCVTVPHGNIIIRSNGKVSVVGNCHALDEEKGRYISFLKHQMQQNPKTKVVGFTATPFRHNGYIYGKDKFFTNPCYERGLSFFISRGYLVHPIAKNPDFKIDTSKLRVVRGEYKQEDIDAQTMNIALARDQVIDALNRMHDRKKVVWFCSSINHAELIKDLLIKENEPALSVHSKMSWDDRDFAMDQFENKDVRHLTFVSVISEGVDIPKIDCVVLMRPTRSPVMMIQTCGRALRPYPEKDSALILDYANVIGTLGSLEDPVINKKGKGGKGEAPPLKSCPECRTYVPPRAMSCPQCGFNWPKAEATKLNLTADEDIHFLSKKPREMEILSVKLTNYVSKAGSKCYRIEYIPKGFLESSIVEYFNWDLPFAFKRFTLRAIDLNIEIDDDYEQTGRNPIRRMPKKVEYIPDGKYPKIKRLIFV